MKAPRAKAIKAPTARVQKFVIYVRLLLYPWALVSLAALIALGLIEFKWPTARHFFGDYPVTIGLIAGLFNLIFTLSVVNRIIQRRDELRWRDIKNTTLKGLNDEVRSTRDILWVALFGQPLFGVSKLTEAACKAAQESSVAWPPTPEGEVGEKVSEAWATIKSDLLWTRTAATILRLATEQIREGLVRWAPMMALARGDYKALVPVTTLADVLEVMEFPFADKETGDGKTCVQAKFHDALLELWLHAITTCVYAEENIVGALYPKHEYPERGDEAWTSDKPRKRMLSPSQLTELGQWLERPRQFKKDTRKRQYAVTKDVKWPW